ncbi:MAG: hypothetical protein CL760_00710 [Chloroflexi bacterium]|nr:hypothetical protein [Chloroflexota bacterium]|tara:strand:+ start:3332 stop:3511 length:180 start_codon:yes stop_codon:yes gene_type:complete
MQQKIIEYKIKKGIEMDFLMKYGSSLDTILVIAGAAIEIIIMILIYMAYKGHKDRNKKE